MQHFIPSSLTETLLNKVVFKRFYYSKQNHGVIQISPFFKWCWTSLKLSQLAHMKRKSVITLWIF